MRFPRITPAVVISVLALVLALSGTAYAAGKIKGSQIAKNAITTKHVKNGSLGTGDLSAAVVAELRTTTPGATGPKGEPGPQGAPGAPGPEGAPGLSGHEIVTADSAPSDADGWATATVACPGSKKALGFGTSWIHPELLNVFPLYESHATVRLNAGGTGYTAYGKAPAQGVVLTLQVVCATIG